MPLADVSNATQTVTVAAVVAARDARGLETCISAIRCGTRVPQEILVVDDGSREPVGELPGARILRTPGIGRGGARNVGARQSSAAYLWFVDSDVVVAPDTLQRLMRELRQVDGAMAVYAERDGSGYESFRRAHHRFHVLQNPEPRHVSAACLLIRHQTFENAGGFPDLPAMEDIAFGLAGWRQGCRWRSVPAASVTHLPRPSWREALLRDHRERGMAAVQFAAREGPLFEHAAAPREIIAYVGLLGCLGGAVVPRVHRRGRVVVASLAVSCWADRPWLRHAWRQRGPAFAVASVPWLFLFRTAVATGVARAYVRGGA